MSVGLLLLAVALLGQADFQERTAVAQRLDLGESAPDWLVESESYIFAPRLEDWEALAQSKVAFVTHCPVNREFFDRCHALGIRCFPYVTFYQGFATQTYQGVNLKDHQDFVEIDAEGNLKRTGFWESEDAKNMYTTCPDVQAYQDAMVDWVRRLMEMGADGVFVDNLSSRVECYGPKFSKHQHMYNDPNHAFAMLLKRVREVVKQYKPDGAVLGNSANPPSLPREFWKYLDAEMLESYICTWVSNDRWFDWKDHWHKAGVDLQDFVRAGKQIQALSYLGHTPYGVREDAFFCYASARLAGFVWSGGSPSDENVADLYRLRLGKACGPEQEQNGVYYRVFERGMVAVNPDKENAREIDLVPTISCHRLLDVFGGGVQSWEATGSRGYRLATDLPHSGSHSIYCATDNLSESAGALQVVELNQSSPVPITLGGWSRAQEVSGEKNGDYSVYADILYTDGTWLYGQIAAFDTGTHDWQHSTITVHPEKPIKSITLNLLLRDKTGRAWFDNISVISEGTEYVRNGDLEQTSMKGRLLDLTETGKLEIPRYSGRVYLFLPDDKNELSVAGPRLTVVTSPALGEVRFRVDGFDYWTHSGRWTTQFELGSLFGSFAIAFEKPGKHTVEIVDVVPSDMKTPAGYGTGERLGTFMDPSNPVKPSEGKKFKFREWEGGVKTPQIELDVSENTVLRAIFDVELPK
ncbi:MAG TPA: putative glycoside hydrolase [Candidatus Hydrogenedentes bacterium]|nr:putative glycoside hydrolase [Candidatus Hydrogenedentota bacterium]HOL77022.1 putative glycoside hydrolase [Candidatus Hydrogenedentota bacterium]HPO85795.1 putative glycoside hydrolase [Candidatus Hydrogenedentota bacterium]